MPARHGSLLIHVNFDFRLEEPVHLVLLRKLRAELFRSDLHLSRPGSWDHVIIVHLLRFLINKFQIFN